MIWSETAGGNYTMGVRMKLQALIPTVEHTEKADLGAEMAWVSSDFKQGLCARMKEQVVDEPLVL